MTASTWGVTPRASIEAECRRRGTRAVALHCVAILRGDAIDEATLLALAGPAAAAVLRGEAGGPAGYWPRVWAARGLLYAWDDVATSALVRLATDESWRVREMSAKVVARHQVGGAFLAMEGLRDDPTARVRRAAERALVRLVAVGA